MMYPPLWTSLLVAMQNDIKTTSIEKLGPAIFIEKHGKLNRKLRSFPLESPPYFLFGSSKFGTETSKSGRHILFVLTINQKKCWVFFIKISVVNMSADSGLY